MNKLMTRFEEFDDVGHPMKEWWDKYGQYMMSGGGRREFIWACRGWIAHEQLVSGVEVTGDSLNEIKPIMPPPVHFISKASEHEQTQDCCGDRYSCNYRYKCSCGVLGCASHMQSHVMDVLSTPGVEVTL
jgi:hypothetical protein